MIIEHVECKRRINIALKGKDGYGKHLFYTSWAYEFIPDSPQIEA